MFCPECGALSFPDSSGNIKCPNYECGYSGVAENKVKMQDGTEVDVSKASSSIKTEARDRRVIDDADQQRGVLTTKTYICGKCDSDQVYAELQQTRSSDEPETRILTCAECGHGWREY
ncbi:MAG: RPA12/RPB9/RPC11 RNA polymerase family protein [Candidatus Thermoplasmatota archaeon]|nr:RPA12/RPB9/RPC11 RNA polymerase family protein [Candidatus Thermoplasmatota archaeon]MED5487283.1 RPA12/RPB9/RPC11 RNA polymerase family protein [Candidatus Thermoplasmatota archaeon]|tara:strand:- start:623 stop:976 length:354 start_codon:yes stop_codon:yes gene_type:complete